MDADAPCSVHRNVSVMFREMRLCLYKSMATNMNYYSIYNCAINKPKENTLNYKYTCLIKINLKRIQKNYAI